MSDQELRDRVLAALQDIRPALRRDGGDVDLVDIKDGVVQVKLQGACAGCPMSQMTLAFGIQRAIKEKVPEIIRVESV